MGAVSSGGRQCYGRNLAVRLSIVRFTEAILTCEMPLVAPAASIASWAARSVAHTRSSSPSSVRLPYSVAEAVDPEEAFVAAVSSCHMLTFLYVAAKQGFVVDSYTDDAVGEMTKNEQGRLWVSKVKLSPQIKFGGEVPPTREQLQHLHHEAHEQCFIANSVKSDIEIIT